MEEQKQHVLPNGISEFLTHREEEMLFAVRQHIFVILIPLGITGLFAITAATAAFFFFSFFSLSLLLFLSGILIIFLAAMSFMVKMVIDWYFHVYIVTTHKILEISYKPFYSAVVNDVLLDQVRCTEIVVETRSLVNHLLDIGDIIIIFDMPTHQDEFHFSDIAAPHKTGVRLATLLSSKTPAYATQMPVWYRRNESESEEKSIRTIFPKVRVGIG